MLLVFVAAKIIIPIEPNVNQRDVVSSLHGASSRVCGAADSFGEQQHKDTTELLAVPCCCSESCGSRETWGTTSIPCRLHAAAH